MTESTESRSGSSSERALPLPPNVLTLPGESRHVEAWREWLRALATNAEAALAAALLYRGLDGAARDAWLTIVEEDADALGVPKFALYAPLLAVEFEPERRSRIQALVGSSDAASPRVPPQALVGVGRGGQRIAVLISPLYLDFVQVLACAYRADTGFDWVRHEPIVDRRCVPKHGERLDGVGLESTPIKPLVDELAYAVLAHRRAGRELPEALRVFADLFGPSAAGSVPPPPVP
ncbi:MAG TPA: hypothetical protein VKY73_19710 [Polyangiaceae bacterium]|nr:hypothetical protein [Polyangiaceae bacterium]